VIDYCFHPRQRKSVQKKNSQRDFFRGYTLQRKKIKGLKGIFIFFVFLSTLQSCSTWTYISIENERNEEMVRVWKTRRLT